MYNRRRTANPLPGFKLDPNSGAYITTRAFSKDKLIQEHETRIKALEAQIATLQTLVSDTTNIATIKVKKSKGDTN
jgi:hypothetical protein